MSNLSAIDVYQKLYQVNTYQFLIRERNPPDQEYVRELDKLIKILKPAIMVLGGIEAIDKWIIENDPQHGLVSNFKGIDLSWLDE